MVNKGNPRLSACLGIYRKVCLLRVLKLGLAAIGESSASGGGPLNPAELSRRIAKLDPAAYDVYCRVDRALPCEHRPLVPQYDCDLRELRLGETLVHRFASQARNAIAILGALANQGWPDWIDDPLDTLCRDGFEKRLHNAVSTLNRVCSSVRIRFFCDGRQRRIGWTMRTAESTIHAKQGLGEQQ